MTDATTNDPTPDVDLPVIGGGMAGMTAAAKAAKSGLRVVVEKGPEVGGSAVLSAGIIAAPADAQEFMGTNPSGDPARVAAFVQHYDDLIDFIESTGVWISPRVDGSTTIGVKTTDVLGFDMRGRAIDMIGYIQWCTAAVEQSGGAVVRSATVERLLTTGGSVTGAVVTDRDGTSDMHARYTLLASGGFHNHDQLKLQHLGPNAPFALSRGNTHSRGTGLQLGTAVGGTASEHMDSFYGHPIIYPIDHEFGVADYTRLALTFLVGFGIAIGPTGGRAFDESAGYWYAARMIMKQPGGTLCSSATPSCVAHPPPRARRRPARPTRSRRPRRAVATTPSARPSRSSTKPQPASATREQPRQCGTTTPRCSPTRTR